MLGLSILLYAALLAFVLWLLWLRAFDPFHPVSLFLVYLFIQVGASNLLYVWFGLPGELSLPLPDYADRYLEATFMGGLATLLVYVGTRIVAARHLRLGAATLPPLSGWKVGWVTLVCFPMGYAACVALIELNGGLAEFLRYRESWRAGGLIGQGYLLLPATTLLNMVALLNLAHAYGASGSPRARAVAVVLLLASVLPASLLGFRSSIILPLFQAILIAHYSGSGVPLRRIALYSAAAIVLVTAYGVNREFQTNAEQAQGSVAQLIDERPELALAVLARSRGADVVATVIERLRATGEFDYGLDSLAEWATIWVPGRLWEDKPVPSGMRFTTYFFGSRLAATRNDVDGYFGGISPTFVGESYWHLGYAGLIVTSLLWGILGQLLYNTMKQHRSKPAVLVFYSLAWTSFIMSAETIQGYANTLLLSTLTLLLLLMATTKWSRTASR